MKKGLFTTALLFLLGTGCVKKEVDLSSLFPAASGSLEGNWTTPCLASSGSTTGTYNYQITGGQYTKTLTVYANAGCTNPIITAIEAGTYSFTSMNSLGSGDVNWTLAGFDLTPLTSTQASTYNASSYCGFTDWQVNVAKNLLGQTCDGNLIPLSGVVEYDIYNINQTTDGFTGRAIGDLEFGLTTDSNHDGSSPSKRPNTTNGNIIYTKY